MFLPPTLRRDRRTAQCEGQDRQAKYLWMKDLLEHLGSCYDNMQSADPHTEQFMAQSIKRDLEEFRRLCSELRTNPDEALYAARHQRRTSAV